MYPGTWDIDFFFSADLAQTWSKRLQTEIFLISITILGYYNLLQSTSDTFYPILSTLKTVQIRIFKFIFLDSHTRVHEILIFFQRRPAQTWSKRLQTEIFLISITILGYYNLLQGNSDTFYPILSTLKTAHTRIFKFIFLDSCTRVHEILIFFSAQNNAELVKKASNRNIFNFYHHFRVL